MEPESSLQCSRDKYYRCWSSGGNVVWTCAKIPKFRKNILPPSSGLKTHITTNLLRNTGLRDKKPVWSTKWRWRQYVPPKRWYLPTSPHGVTTQKTNTDIFALRTSHLRWILSKLSHPVSLRSIRIIIRPTSHLSLGFPNHLFPSGYPTEIPHLPVGNNESTNRK
jgi:hypothetical protein